MIKLKDWRGMRDSQPQVRAHACVVYAWVGEVVVEIPVGAGVLVFVSG